jgi:quercetin dioxygenase-like cupin family protein
LIQRNPENAEKKNKKSIFMKSMSLTDAPKVPSGLDAHKMYTSPSLDVIHLHLAPNEQVAVHSNPVDVVFCIIQGTVTMEAGGQTIHLNTFDVIEVLAGVERGLKNDSEEELRVLILKKL